MFGCASLFGFHEMVVFGWGVDVNVGSVEKRCLVEKRGFPSTQSSFQFESASMQSIPHIRNQTY